MGLNAAGTLALGNGLGIQAAGGGAVVGGATVNARNIISGNVVGVQSSGGSTIQGNFIGTDISGTSAVPNGIGIHLSSREREHDRRNDRNAGDASGKRHLGKQRYFGVNLDSHDDHESDSRQHHRCRQERPPGAPQSRGGCPAQHRGRTGSNVVGGSAAGDRNLISGNSYSPTAAGVLCLECGTGSAVKGNWIGVDISGTSALPNGIGVRVSGNPRQSRRAEHRHRRR